ncbi:MAG: discoidin domain-containing protein, partial [Roseiflexaceae bacterium]
LVISPLGKPAFQSTVAYTHYSLLRTIEDAWDFSPLANAAHASPMADFFGTAGPEPTSPPPPTAPPTQRLPRTPTPSTGATPVPSPTPSSGATCLAAPIRSAQANGDDGNGPANVLDNDLNTRWSNQGLGSWIVADLGSAQTVCGVGIAWYQGDARSNHFILQGSADGTNFVNLYGGDSSGKTTASESYTFPSTRARYLRVVVNGNTRNDWASITELRVSVSGAAPAPTAVPAPTAPPLPPPPSAGSGIWISPAELAKLPMSGSAWDRLKTAADSDFGTPNIADQNSQHDTNTLAAALVYARTGEARYRSKAAAAIMAAIGTERGGRTLALGRNLVSYVIAADLIDLKRYDAGKDQQFRSWLAAVRTETLDGKTLISTHEMRPNNWGTHAGASRIAADLYLGDKADFAKAAQVFAGWLGDRSAYVGFTYGDLAWQARPDAPVGINPRGATKNGESIDGVLPDDQRRAGGFTWPPQKENYVWEGLQGAVVQAELLHRAGYDAWNWSDKALLRA